MEESGDPQEVVLEGLHRLKDELECAKEHFDARDFAGLTMHLTNLAYGCQIIAQILVEHLLDQETLVELTRQKLQEKLGMPVEFMGEVNGVMGFHGVEVQAPDDLSELDEIDEGMDNGE